MDCLYNEYKITFLTNLHHTKFFKEGFYIREMEELMFELFDKDRFQERLNRVLFIGNKDFEEEARKLSEDSGIEFSGEEVESTYKDFSNYGSVFLGKPQVRKRRKTLVTYPNTKVVYPLMLDVSNLFCSKSNRIGSVVVE